MSILKTPDGKRYSRKNITWVVSLTGLFVLVVIGGITGNWPPSYIIADLVALITLVLAGTIIDKKIKNNEG